jgi:hypothetical protein
MGLFGEKQNRIINMLCSSNQIKVLLDHKLCSSRYLQAIVIK